MCLPLTLSIEKNKVTQTKLTRWSVTTSMPWPRRQASPCALRVLSRVTLLTRTEWASDSCFKTAFVCHRPVHPWQKKFPSLAFKICFGKFFLCLIPEFSTGFFSTKAEFQPFQAKLNLDQWRCTLLKNLAGSIRSTSKCFYPLGYKVVGKKWSELR